LREVTTAILIGDILEGKVDVGYVTYLGYDEIAHHSGTRDWDSFYALSKLDKQFHRLEQARRYAPRPYHLVIQSDHGQSNGATFLQRYGISLEDVVRELMPPETRIYSKLSSNEDHFGQAIQDPLQDGKQYLRSRKNLVADEGKSIFNRAVKEIDESPVVKGRVMEYLKRHKMAPSPSKKDLNSEDAQVIVLASGNLGLIYLTDHKKRLSFEQIKAIYPDLIPGLARQEGVGFLMLHSEEYGPLAIDSGGVHYLYDGSLEGEDPLKPFGASAVKHLIRTNSFQYAPDILVNSSYYDDTDEVAAFEELVGSHGGLGGEQSRPFILHPSEWELGAEEIVGAEHLHQVLKKELERLNL
jgi:hypothetical protein